MTRTSLYLSQWLIFFAFVFLFLKFPLPPVFFFFFFNDTATTEIYTLSLHDALPICKNILFHSTLYSTLYLFSKNKTHQIDRKSTRLNSSHLGISYAVFCLKKKKQMSYLDTRISR